LRFAPVKDRFSAKREKANKDRKGSRTFEIMKTAELKEADLWISR
jgi:hypothetical protein